MNYPKALINANIEDLKKKQVAEFTNIEQELLGMRVTLVDSPSSENLLQLFETISKTRAYFERSSEIFRSYLKYTNMISLLRFKAEEQYKLIESKAQKECMDADMTLYKGCKSGDERTALIKQYIPEQLSVELVAIKNLESMATTNLRIIRSYMDSFKSVREDILAQLSIVKNLIALGGINIDANVVKSINTLDKFWDKPDGSEIPSESSYEEGIVNLGGDI